MATAQKTSICKGSKVVKSAMANIYFLAKSDCPSSMIEQLNSFMLYQNKGTTKNGWHVTEITDGCVFIQTVFTKTAVEKCLGDNGTSVDLNSAVLLLRDIRLELQHSSTNEAEFVIVVDDFVIWDHQRGFKLTKTSIKSCMEDGRVQDAVKLYVSTHGHAENITEMGDNGESQSLSVLLQEMAEASAESDTSIPGQQSSETSRTEEDWVMKLTKPFDIKEFVIPNAAENILKGLKEWDADYRIPASSSGEMVIQSSSVKDYSMGGLNTFAGQNESLSERNENNQKDKHHENKDMCELNSEQSDSEKLPAPESRIGYNQTQSEISCWQACMDSVQLSDESLDIGQPDAHSTQVEKESRNQDLRGSQASRSSDGANDSIRCSKGRGEVGQQSSSVEIIEKNNSIILISSSSENSYNVLSKDSLEKVKQHDQAELKRLEALSVTSYNVSDSSTGEFSHSELYRTSVLNKHLNCEQTDQTTEPKNKGSEDLFIDSTTTEEHSGKSCDKGEHKTSDISQTFGTDQEDTCQNNSLLIDTNDSRNSPESLRYTENKENENSKVDSENRRNIQVSSTNNSRKGNFENLIGGSRSTIQRLRLCQELLRKTNTVSKTRAKLDQSCVNTQQSCTVRSSKSSDDFFSRERQYSELEKRVMWKYYFEKSPVKSHNFRNKVDKCGREESGENDSEVMSTPVDINTELTTLNSLTSNRNQESEKQNYTLSLHTNYEFTQTGTEKDKMQYMNSLELSPSKVSNEPINLYCDVNKVVEINDQCQLINPDPAVSTSNDQIYKSRRTQPTHTDISQASNTKIRYDRLSSRSCFVVLERLTKDVLDSWKHRGKSELNDKKRKLNDDSTESLVMNQNERVFCKRSNTAKTCRLKRSSITQYPSSITKSSLQVNQNENQKEANFKQNENQIDSNSLVTESSDRDVDDAVCSTQPFITVVTQSQGFVPMSQDKELAYLGPFVLSNCDSDSFQLLSYTEKAKRKGSIDDREIDVTNTGSESRKFRNQQTTRKAAIDKMKMTRKKYAEKLGIDIERLSNKNGNKKQKELDISVDSCNHTAVDVKETHRVEKEELGTDDNADETFKMEIVSVPEITNVLEKKSHGFVSLQQSQNIEHETPADQDLSKNYETNESIEKQHIVQSDQNIDDNEKKVYERQTGSLSNNTRQTKVDDKTCAFISSLQYNEHPAPVLQVDQSLLKSREKVEKNENEFKCNELENTTDGENIRNIDSFESSEIPVYNECVGEFRVNNTNNGQCRMKSPANNKTIIDSFESSEIPVYNECVGESRVNNTNNSHCRMKSPANNKTIIDSFESSEIPVYNECVGEFRVDNTNNGQCRMKSPANNKTIISLDIEKQRLKSVTNEDTRKNKLVTNEPFTIPINGTQKKSGFPWKRTSDPYSEGGRRSKFVGGKSITYPVNGKWIESLTNHQQKRKRNEFIAVESEKDLSRKVSTRKHVCLETSQVGSSFECSDAEMDYLLSKCPSERNLLDCPKAYSPVRNLSSDRSILITLFPVMKALEKEYKLNPINKKKKKKCAEDGFFSIPVKKLKRQPRRINTPESEKIASGSNSEEKSEMLVAKVKKVQQSSHTYSAKSRRHFSVNQSPSKDITRASTQVCEESYIARPSTSTGVGKLSSNTSKTDIPFTAGYQKPGQVGSNLRLTVDKSTGACRFSRLATVRHSNNYIDQLDIEPVHVSTLRGKGPAKNSTQEGKQKQSSKELCRNSMDVNEEAKKTGEFNVETKNRTVRHENNKKDTVSLKTDDLISSDVSKDTNSDKLSEVIVRLNKKTGSHTNNEQKSDVKKGTGTNSDEFTGTNKSKVSTDIDRKSNQMINEGSEGVELPQRSLRKRKINVVTLTRESLKIHNKSQIDKDLFLQEWLETSIFGASSEDDD